MPINNEIELRSDEVQEILGTPPRWIIRWGITIILLVVIVLLAGSYFYKYPDLIPARVTILSENPPVQIVAKANGKLDQLFVENNQQVVSGEILGVIENTANYSDAYRLLEKLDTIETWFHTPKKFNEISFSENYSLGQYHSYFSSFVSQLRSYQTSLIFNPFNQRIESLQKQVRDYRNFFEKSRDQIVVLRQDYELAFNQFYRDSTLYRQQIMSEVDYERSKAAMLKQKYAWQNAQAALANTQITMNNLTQQIQEQEVLRAETESQLLAALKEKYDNLVNELAAWEQTFILKTPIAGQVTFTNFWSPNQYISLGNVVFTVVPNQEQTIIGRAIVPIAGAGKIETGQRVNIKLDNYPHIEYGIVSGQVVNISKVPVTTEEGAFYTAEISLVNDLTTNYDRELPFSQEMQGVAEIVTKDRRLIERLIDPLISIVKERL
ncbi:HlyD family efflux transporter periplasmic adaptor subunit [Mariniphaga sediminis]|uniref:HlyD family efflux transporter periplasmic adaptor subunit n=1 Tax=Mariniphaga sediminis TaxID=1628158 RepID=A0A399D4Q7_9BACT|nr:HlyD family efflux transporter periplasmic adaptor subunit [Mariniphaga sediminis]RIH64278.1 HlyD family efflux transporter periplasmic adaptor subunit [Mariniphaga sediminis]RIH66557.1 HlyD family efflux transporter periplasmic adaptor subunit [Mariniphaga sediminis]